MEEDIERGLKVIIVGNGCVGKSSMTRRFCKQKFTDKYKKTIGVDFLERKMYVEDIGEDVHYMVWDTAGQEEFDSITSRYYGGAGASVFVFSTTDRESFEAMKSWKRKVQKQCGNITSALVQNKMDLADKAVVTEDEVYDLADELGMELFRVSVKEDYGVTELFKFLATESARGSQTEESDRLDTVSQKKHSTRRKDSDNDSDNDSSDQESAQLSQNTSFQRSEGPLHEDSSDSGHRPRRRSSRRSDTLGMSRDSNNSRAGREYRASDMQDRDNVRGSNDSEDFRRNSGFEEEESEVVRRPSMRGRRQSNREYEGGPQGSMDSSQEQALPPRTPPRRKTREYDDGLRYEHAGDENSTPRNVIPPDFASPHSRPGRRYTESAISAKPPSRRESTSKTSRREPTSKTSKELESNVNVLFRKGPRPSLRRHTIASPERATNETSPKVLRPSRQRTNGKIDDKDCVIM